MRTRVCSTSPHVLVQITPLNTRMSTVLRLIAVFTRSGYVPFTCWGTCGGSTRPTGVTSVRSRPFGELSNSIEGTTKPCTRNIAREGRTEEAQIVQKVIGNNRTAQPGTTFFILRTGVLDIRIMSRHIKGWPMRGSTFLWCPAGGSTHPSSHHNMRDCIHIQSLDSRPDRSRNACKEFEGKCRTDQRGVADKSTLPTLQTGLTCASNRTESPLRSGVSHVSLRCLIRCLRSPHDHTDLY
ncbi:hypothetical protein Bbelb_405100 [Branchiostoma belcheri]|nr:hypothetical protein Bbelb_405100 [Branchiostoma belcheri]